MSLTAQTNAETDANQAERLLDEFPPTSYEEWRQIAEQSLKGVPFEKKLITRTYEGIDVQPMYWAHDLAGLPHLDGYPGFAPFVRGSTPLGALGRPWAVAQTLPYREPGQWNSAATHDLARGQTALHLVPDRATQAGLDPDQASPADLGRDGLSVATVADLQTALHEINLERVPMFAQAGADPLPFAALLLAVAHQRGIEPETLRGMVAADPLAVLARTGTLRSLAHAYDNMALLTSWAAARAPQLATIAVDGGVYHESGGNAVQELAFTLAAAVAYVRAMQERGLAVEMVAPRIRFTFAVGANIFMEIARLRAARLLWSNIVAAFGGSPTAQQMHVHVRTGLWNKTRHDPYVNLLRTTAEAFAAIIGGCDSLDVGSFDAVVREPDEFGRRIARNTQLILRDESQLTRVVDPAGGAYYVEALTDALARRAWALFQEVERQGGMVTALQSTWVQGQIKATARERDKNLATRKDLLVGTNIYPNLHESPLDQAQSDHATFAQRRRDAVVQLRDTERAGLAQILDRLGAAGPEQRVELAIEAALAQATIGEISSRLAPMDEPITLEPLRLYRGAEQFEALRAEVDAYAARRGERPQAFLANMGPLAQHKARADFVTGFLGVAGVQVIGSDGFATVEDAAAAAIQAGAPVVVICSTDDTYPELVPPLTERIKAAKPETQVLLAGYPADQVEAHRAAGIDDFVHLRANVVEVLDRLLHKIGVSA